VIGAPADSQPSPTSQPSPASQPSPTIQPAGEIILIRIGPETITQADFDRAMQHATLDDYYRSAGMMIHAFIDDALLALYLKDHPELVPESEVDRRVNETLKRLKYKSVDELLEKKLRPASITIEEYRRDKRHEAAKVALTRQGMKTATDEAKLRQIYDKRRSEFDDTRIEVHQIFIAASPVLTPAQREEKRKKLVAIRKAIQAGQLTWTEAVKQSDDPSAGKDGSIGALPRYLRYYTDEVMKTAFKLKTGQMSDVFESRFGFHLIKAVRRVPGRMRFERAKRFMRIYFERLPYRNALAEMTKKYGIIGVRAPEPPAHLKPLIKAAETQPATKPSP
jgi:hypothetical protein